MPSREVICAHGLLGIILSAFSVIYPLPIRAQQMEPHIQQLNSATEDARVAKEGVTLDELQSMAIQFNPTLVQARAQVQASQGMALQAGLPPNPNAGYVAEQMGLNGTAGELQGGFVSQEFVLGNKLGLSRAKYIQRSVIARTNLSTQQVRVCNDVAIRFYAALAAQEILAIHERLLETAKDNVQTHEEMLNLGQLGEAEVLQAEVELQRQELTYKQAHLKFDQSWRELMAFVGDPYRQRSMINGTFDLLEGPLDWESTVAQLLSTSPELTAARQKVLHDQIAVQRELAEPTPNVTVQATVGRNTEVGQSVAGVTVGLPIPILNRNQGTIRQAQADLARARAEVTRLELQLQAELTSRYQEYVTAWQYVQEYESTMIPKSRLAVEKLDTMYKARRAPWLSVLGAKRNLLTLELDLIDKKFQYITSDIVVRGNLLTGGLTEPSGPVSGGHIDAVNQPR
jgi:cobalt-zinc-cadmium efflux system outer membrane protein